MKTIAYQGAEGAFSHLTAVKAFGKNNRYCGLNTFREVFEKLARNEVDFAMIPIENSLIGSIYENYDLLNRYGGRIVGEYFTRIEHCLLTIPSTELNMIKKVMSHPKALEQCRLFFQEHPGIEAVVHPDTAGAAAEVASRHDSSYAAIASAEAGELYGLEILMKGIEDNDKNYTRFVSVTKTRIEEGKPDKCSLLIRLKHSPGTLARMLAPFADGNVNLTKIESRPLQDSPFNYVFYIDFEFEAQNDIKSLLDNLQKGVQELKILGFYQRGTLWTN